MKFSYKQIWLVVYPVLFSLLMEHMIGLTDTAFLGRVGEIELGASALAGVYYMAIYMLAFGFSIGAQILIARRNGEGRYNEIGAIFQQGVLFLLFLAAVMFLVSKTFSPRVLSYMITSPKVYEATILYMDWRVYGFFFSFVAVMFRAFFVGTTNTKILSVNATVMVLSNIGLNYVLIFGKFGFPQMGIAGAAIASSVAELVSVLFFIIYTFLKVDNVKYNLLRFARFSPKLLSHILGVSLWTMMQSFISVGTWFLFFVAVEHLGERPLAITNIVRSISSLIFMVLSAYASTASSLVSNLMGAGQQRQVMGLSWRIIKMCYLTILPLLLIIYIFPLPVLRVYTDSLNLIDASVPSLWVMASVYLVHIPAVILFNTVSGTGNTRTALLTEFGSLVIYVIYTVYIVLYLRADVAVCWTTEHVYGIVLLLLSFLYLRRGNWQNKRI